MRIFRIISVVLISLLMLSLVASAADKGLGISENRNITFSSSVRLGNNLLQPGDYNVRHTMQGEEHIMIFRRAGAKDEVKVKCNLVKLAQKAPQTSTIIEVNSANERVVREIVFRGDTAKHVF
ncbi:MAG TPA: hypothetical protein VFO39_13370 [Candidatus Sulfotelmatobacter sp.]|nr:hypothetical protein [Candidatus Sulfotelmatobacter sp.]